MDRSWLSAKVPVAAVSLSCVCPCPLLMKILLVEDHPNLADISCRLLREVHGHEVVHASSVDDSLRLVETFIPDVALIDLNLPERDGYALARELRKDRRF